MNFQSDVNCKALFDFFHSHHSLLCQLFARYCSGCWGHTANRSETPGSHRICILQTEASEQMEREENFR